MPAARAVLEKDGCTMVAWSSYTNPITFSETDLGNVNGHGTGKNCGWTGGSIITVSCAFPEARDFKGLYVSIAGSNAPGTLNVFTSTDTTNGMDGTWVSAGSHANPGQVALQPYYRGAIQPFNVPGCKGVRVTATTGGYDFQGGPTLYGFHVYADLLGATVSNRVQLWHPTLDQPLAANDLNWGDTPRGSSADKTFRVKNCSATKTANSIVLKLWNPSSATWTTPPELLMVLSSDGTNFAATQSVGSLSPGSISSVFTVRRIVPDAYAVGPWQPSVWPDVTSWT
jgi:hypothetical protein